MRTSLLHFARAVLEVGGRLGGADMVAGGRVFRLYM